MVCWKCAGSGAESGNDCDVASGRSCGEEDSLESWTACEASGDEEKVDVRQERWCEEECANGTWDNEQDAGRRVCDGRVKATVWSGNGSDVSVLRSWTQVVSSWTARRAARYCRLLLCVWTTRLTCSISPSPSPSPFRLSCFAATCSVRLVRPLSSSTASQKQSMKFQLRTLSSKTETWEMLVRLHNAFEITLESTCVIQFRIQILVTMSPDICGEFGKILVASG